MIGICVHSFVLRLSIDEYPMHKFYAQLVPLASYFFRLALRLFGSICLKRSALEFRCGDRGLCNFGEISSLLIAACMLD